MKKQLRSKIEGLRKHLTSSEPISAQVVCDIYAEFCNEINKKLPRKKSTGCVSCLRSMVMEMTKYIDDSKAKASRKKDEITNSPILDNPNGKNDDENKDDEVAQQENEKNDDENDVGENVADSGTHSTKKRRRAKD